MALETVLRVISLGYYGRSTGKEVNKDASQEIGQILEQPIVAAQPTIEPALRKEELEELQATKNVSRTAFLVGLGIARAEAQREIQNNKLDEVQIQEVLAEFTKDKDSWKEPFLNTSANTLQDLVKFAPSRKHIDLLLLLACKAVLKKYVRIEYSEHHRDYFYKRPSDNAAVSFSSVDYGTAIAHIDQFRQKLDEQRKLVPQLKIK